MDVSIIKKKLYSLRLKVRTLFLIEGLAKCMLVAAAFAIVTFVLDYVAGLAFPLPVRILLLAGSVGVLVYVFYRYLWYPVTTPLTDDNLALCVEQGYPFLADRLIGSLQLARSAQDDPFTSSEMVAALVAETNGLIETVRFRGVAKAAHVIVYFLAVVVLAGPIAVFRVADKQGLSDIWLRRYVLMSHADWPKLTDVWLCGINSYSEDLSDIIVAQGDDVTIEVNTGRKQPSRAAIVWTMQDGAERSGAMTPRPPARKGDPKPFRYTLKEVPMSFSFYVQAGDARTPTHHVRVVERPRVKGNPQVTVTLPPYLDKVKVKIAGISGGYVRDLPVGSELTVSVQPSDDVDNDKIFLQFPNEAGRAEREPVRMYQDTAAEGRFKTSFQVYKNLVYSIAMTKTYEIALPTRAGKTRTRSFPIENADRGIGYEVVCEPDKTPTAVITHPTEDKPATTQSRIRIKGLAADDYELGRILLQYVVLQEKTSNLENLEWKSLTIAEFDPQTSGYEVTKEYNVDYNLNLAELGVKAGQFVLYRLAAEDRYKLDAQDEKEAYDLAVARAAKEEKAVVAAMEGAGLERTGQLTVGAIDAAVGELEGELAGGQPDEAKSKAVAVLKEALPLYQDVDKKAMELRSKSGPNTGLSKIMSISVLTEVDIQQIMYEKVHLLRSKLGRLYDRQLTVKDNVTKMMYADYFQSMKFRVGDYLETQQLITKYLRNLADEFVELADELKEAGVFENLQKIMRDEVSLILRDIAGGPSPTAASGIAQMQLLIANRETAPPEAGEIKRKIVVEQIRVLEGIDKIFNLLPNLEDLGDAISGLRHLQEKLEDIRALLDEIAK